jgi:hypothetical protein
MIFLLSGKGFSKTHSRPSNGRVISRTKGDDRRAVTAAGRIFRGILPAAVGKITRFGAQRKPAKKARTADAVIGPARHRDSHRSAPKNGVPQFA